MSNTIDDRLRDLETSHRDLQKLFSELFVRVFAIQTLLPQNSQFTSAELEHRISEITTTFSARVEGYLAAIEESERREAIRRVLESYEGTKQ